VIEHKCLVCCLTLRATFNFLLIFRVPTRLRQNDLNSPVGSIRFPPLFSSILQASMALGMDLYAGQSPASCPSVGAVIYTHSLFTLIITPFGSLLALTATRNAHEETETKARYL
jgi:hypothetical protein